jgi:hypothetical protein
MTPPRGDVELPLDEDQVRTAALELKDAGVQSIAICFLFSYINPEHERRAKAIVEQFCPEVFVTCSHEVAPQFREFERFTTTAMNAFIGPLVRDYVARLAEGLRADGFRGEVHIMMSNGGVAPARTISQLPVKLTSGPCAGCWAAPVGVRGARRKPSRSTSAARAPTSASHRRSLRRGRARHRDAGYPIQADDDQHDRAPAAARSRTSTRAAPSRSDRRAQAAVPGARRVRLGRDGSRR